MKCPLCGREFQESEANTACSGCLITRNCHIMKCPNCGYEIPEEPKLIKAFKAWKEGKNGIRRKS
jgi:hypothetical protein